MILILLAMTLCAESIAYAITCAFPKRVSLFLSLSLRSYLWFQIMSTVVTLLVMLLLIMFGGFYLNANNTPPYTASLVLARLILSLFSSFLFFSYFLWVQYISYVRYGFEALAINEFLGVKFVCDNT